MEIITLTLRNNYMSSNCYILKKDNNIVVIDPGFEDDTLYDYIKKNKLKIDKIILTHGHYDHWTGLEKLLKLYPKTKLYASLLDEYWLNNNPFTKYVPNIDYNLNEFDEINILNETFKVLKTPGHSKGSVSLLYKDILISGDLLFKNGIGRYDLEGGNFNTLKESVNSIYKLDEFITIYPGHGSKTTIKHEKYNNPFINIKS